MLNAYTKINIIETKRKFKAMNKIMTIMADKIRAIGSKQNKT